MFKLAPDEKVLGDLVISPSFVLRQCAKDKAAVEAAASVKPTEVIKSTGSISAKDYVHLDEYGVTKAMSTEFTLEKRIPLLMIHGILHLLEHDHETDEDWKRMVEREEEVLLQFLGKKTTSTNKSKTKSKKVIQR